MLRISWALLVTVLTLGCSPALNWREWRVEETRLRSMFPCKPIRQQRKVQLAGHDLTMVLHVCDAAGVTWAQAHADVKDPAAVASVLQALSRASHANIGSPLTTAVPAMVAGATPQADSGRFLASGQAPGGKGVELGTLVFAHGTTVFQTTALGPKLAADDLDTFLGSVRLDR